MTRLKQMTVAAAAVLALGASGPLEAQKPAAAKTVQKAAPVAAKVYLTPTCGCCSKWADHMKAAGFALERETLPQADHAGEWAALRHGKLAEVLAFLAEHSLRCRE
mgnify:CR=1 FL=1